MFRFSVENLTTRESADFIGQGASLLEALSDGIKNCNQPFRPKNDGKARPNIGLAVRLPDGRVVTRQTDEFGSAIPYNQPPAPAVTVEEY